MGECVGERVAAFVALGCRRRVNVDVVAHKELLQHLPSGDEEVTVATLTSELEGVVGRCLRPRCTIAAYRLLKVGRNGHLELALYALHKIYEIWGSAKAGKVRVGWHGHIRLERYVILRRISRRQHRKQ